jgi:hypothetical protein
MDLPDRFTVDDACVFWRGLQVPDKAAIARLEAVPFPGGTDWAAIEGSEDAVVDGEPLLWHAPDRSVAFVNARFFSSLIVVDATSLEGVAEIGTAQPELAIHWQAGEVLRFLIRAGIVRTFAHTHAELVLRKRVTGAARHVEVYDATHVYFTNEENRADYAFALALSFGSGRIEAMPS